MNADVPALVRYFETYLGPIQSGLRLSEGVQGVTFREQPVTGATAFTTLGLCNHLLAQKRGPSVRVEFLLACQNSFIDSFRPLSVLADVSDQALALHSAPPRGRFFAESQMEALYYAAPVYFQDGLVNFSGFVEPLLLIWLVPISPAEAAFVKTHGWSRFETLLTELDPDLLDLLRAPVVDHE